MTEATIRAWWGHRQALDGSLYGAPPAEILTRTGWARSVAGVGPYLTLYSRGRVSRTAADAAVAALEIHELPSARGCTYVVPAADFALALQLSQPFREPERNAARKLGVTDKEIDKLCAAVVKALAHGALDPDGIRQAVGGASRSLGEEGKKKGLTTTLPLALGRLQAEGEIRRVPVNGRLDQQRYKYVAWSPNPLAGFKLSYEECCVELARRYFTWIGPATLAEFQWFSSLSGKAAKAAVAPLGLASLDDRLMFPSDLDALRAFQPPKKPHYEAVGSLDGLALLRRDLRAIVAAEDQANGFFTKGSGLMDLPDHAIVDRGRVVGLWEFDPESNSIAWTSFCKPDAALQAVMTDAEAYVRDQLGDARSFSLDSVKSRAPKIARIRGA